MAEPALKTRRLRAGTACNSCRQRRYRCDATQPRCANCRMRSIPCNYPQATRAEFINADMNGSRGSELNTRTPSRRRKRIGTKGDLVVANIQSSVGSPPNFPQDSGSDDLTAHDILKQHTYFGVSSTVDFEVDACRKDTDAINSSYRQSRSLSGVINPERERSAELLVAPVESWFELPGRALADQLLDAYFRETHILYPFLHGGDFRAEFENVWQMPFSGTRRVQWFAVLNMAFAWGCQSYPAMLSENAAVVATSYVARAKSIIMGHVLTASTLETIQALLLLCNHLQSVGELDLCWNMAGLLTRIAQSLGLHISPCSEQFSPTERELRKRAWAGCLVLDRSLSLSFGRPSTLAGQFLDANMPLEVDDQYICNNSNYPQQPLGIPSVLSFLVRITHLSEIVSDVSTKLYLRDFYSDNIEPSAPRCNHVLSTVLLLDGQLQLWSKNTPEQLRQGSTDLDPGGTDMYTQRILLNASYLYVRLLIHRRTYLYFLRNSIDDSLLRSTAIASTRLAVEISCSLIKLLHSSDRQHQLHPSAQSAQYLFASLCTLSVLEWIDPDKILLLEGKIDHQEARKCRQMGMELLRNIGEQNKLVARFLAILRRLQGSSENKTLSDLVQHENSEKNISRNARHAGRSQQHSGTPLRKRPWIPFGSMFDTYIDFSDLDVFLPDFH